MGLFRALKSFHKKAEAAVVVQRLFENLSKDYWLMPTLDPAMTANRIVGQLWDSLPNILNGRSGQRPHKLSVAAAALALAIKNGKTETEEYTACMLSLGTVLREYITKGSIYPLNSLDEHFFEIATAIYTKEAAQFKQKNAAFIHDMDKILVSSDGLAESNNEASKGTTSPGHSGMEQRLRDARNPPWASRPTQT